MMEIVDIIIKKRNGGTLNEDEIRFFVDGCTAGSIPDYQISAFLMAVWFSGMDKDETLNLTLRMAESGDLIDLSKIPGVKVDKHSTGGVGDTTTLITVPLVAACGGRVAKISGRGLGHTGGTLDKLESIPGMSVFLDMKRFIKNVSDHGLAITGQTGDLVPADKKLYALRDVTGTIDSVSLIASSIMSKKIASGSDAVVLDVKTGSGAFMRDPAGAVSLAKLMVDIGILSGRKTMAIVSDMNQPLGNAVGNAIEVKEAVGILKGEYQGDLKDVSLELAACMLIAGETLKTRDEAVAGVKDAIASGRALEKLGIMIEAQGGNPGIIENTDLLPESREKISFRADKTGYIVSIEASEIGMASLLLGAGRRKKTDSIDPAVGIWMKKRLGDYVRKGDELGIFHVNSRSGLEESFARFREAVKISASPPVHSELIYEIIGDRE